MIKNNDNNMSTELNFDDKYFDLIKKCPVCGSDLIRKYKVYRFSEMTQDIKGKMSKSKVDYSTIGINGASDIRFSKCKNCTFVFQNPRPNKLSINYIYNDSKINKYRNDSKYIINSKQNKKWERNNKLSNIGLVLRLIVNQVNQDELSVLEIGSGFGTILALLNEFEIQGTGIDVDQFRIDYCRKKGLDVKSPEDFMKHDSEKKYSLIILNNVLEHLLDLEWCLSILKNSSRKNTLLYLSLPNQKGLKPSTNLIEHINFFSNKSLDYYLSQVNFAPKKNVYYETTIKNRLKILYRLFTYIKFPTSISKYYIRTT